MLNDADKLFVEEIGKKAEFALLPLTGTVHHGMKRMAEWESVKAVPQLISIIKRQQLVIEKCKEQRDACFNLMCEADPCYDFEGSQRQFARMNKELSEIMEAKE